MNKLCVGMLLTLFVTHTAAPQETLSRGEATAAVFNDFVQVALPGVAALVKAIWGDRSKNMSKADLEQAVAQARAQMALEARNALVPAGQLARELVLLERFVVPAVEMNQGAGAILALLASDNPDWSRINTEWRVLSTHLDGVKTINEEAVRTTVMDSHVRNSLILFLGLNKSARVRMTDALEGQNVSEAFRITSIVLATTKAIPIVLGDAIMDLRKGLEALAELQFDQNNVFSSNSWGVPEGSFLAVLSEANKAAFDLRWEKDQTDLVTAGFERGVFNGSIPETQSEQFFIR